MQIQNYAKKYLPQPIVDVLRVVKYRFELATFMNRVVSHRYGPYRFDMNINDRVAEEWYDRDWALPPEITFLSEAQLPRAGRIFDLGAHQCLLAMLLKNEVVPAGAVVAVEANRHNADIARRNLETNGVDNVDVVRALISSRTGRAHVDASFNSRAKQGLDALVSDAVAAMSIDELSHHKGWPDLVYMDIEGFEIEALKGASQTLARWCHWFIELHGDETLSRYSAKNSDVFQFFGYQDFARYLCPLTGDKFRLLSESEPVPSERCYMIFVPRSARLINQTSADGHASWQ